MIIHDKGHVYEPISIDGNHYEDENIIVFVKREGQNYPGNVGHHAGTISQELMRIIIDRAKYLNAQIPHHANEIVIHNQRNSIFEYESRAAERHSRKLLLTSEELNNIETLPTCNKCGHIKPETHIECSIV